MSTLFYNGISLRIVKTDSYERTPVYDGFSYLYTRHRLRVQAVYNPQATSATLAEGNALEAGGGPALRAGGPGAAPNVGGPGPAGRVPVQEPGHNPALTDVALRHYLSQPRKELLYTAAGEDPLGGAAVLRDGGRGEQLVVLRSPLPRTDGAAFTYDCDATGGPFPTVHGVSQVSGSRTFRVWFSVETCLNESSLYVTTPPLLVSQQWSVRDVLDEDYYCTRIIRGTAVLRRDLLEQQSLKADDFRAVVPNHPVATNSRRTHVDWWVKDDGCTLEYELHDKEQASLPTYYSVSRIEAFAEVGRDGGASAADLGPAVFKAVAGGLKGDSGALSGGAAVLGSVLPTVSVMLTVRVWGRRGALLGDLYQAANRIISAKFPRANNEGEFNGYWSWRDRLLIDVTGSFVQWQSTYICNPARVVYEDKVYGSAVIQKFPELFDPEGTSAGAWTRQNRAGKGPPDTFARGTQLDAAVTQRLWGGDINAPGARPTSTRVNAALP